MQWHPGLGPSPQEHQFLTYKMEIISASKDLLKPVLLSYGKKKAPKVIL